MHLTLEYTALVQTDKQTQAKHYTQHKEADQLSGDSLDYSAYSHDSGKHYCHLCTLAQLCKTKSLHLKRSPSEASPIKP